jgi:hypothetical protein
VARMFAWILGRRGLLLAIAIVAAALLGHAGARPEGLWDGPLFGPTGLWDGPH